MKVPTSGTEVYNAIARYGTGATTTIAGVGFTPDLVLIKRKDANISNTVINRLTGKRYLLTDSTSADDYNDMRVPDNVFNAMDGIITGTSSTYTNLNGGPYINHFFKRATADSSTSFATRVLEH